MNNFMEQVPLFILLLIRIVSFFMMIPIFSYRTLPIQYRIGLAFFLAYIMMFTVQTDPIAVDGLFLLLVIKEALAGLVLGLLGFIILSAIQVAGGFIDFQMGFAIANVFDPQTGAQSPVLGQYLYVFALLFFLSIDGHHLLIDGLYTSYQFIPLDQPFLAFGDAGTMEMIARTFAAMFAIAFQIAAPIVGSIFLVDVALGIVARTVPQMNIFVVGIPVKILVSFLLMLLILSPMIYAFRNLFEFMLYALRDFIVLLGKG